MEKYMTSKTYVERPSITTSEYTSRKEMWIMLKKIHQNSFKYISLSLYIYIYLNHTTYQCGALPMMFGCVTYLDRGPTTLLGSINNVYIYYTTYPFLYTDYNSPLGPQSYPCGPQGVLLHRNVENRPCPHIFCHWILLETNVLFKR